MLDQITELVTLPEISKQTKLAVEIQEELIALGLLAGPADGRFGKLSTNALEQFQDIYKINEPMGIGKTSANTLIGVRTRRKAPLKTNGFASKVLNYMIKKDYVVFHEPNHFNIIYIEGIDADFKLNNDEPNKFNDRRIVIAIAKDNTPVIFGSWQATSEPGSYYTNNPMNSGGAARIKFDQYRAWKVGTHGNSDPHEGLVQVLPVGVHRDFNKDFKRTNDKVSVGNFGINQHWGYDLPTNNIGKASAGCLVGRTRNEHREFMSMIKKDPRYINNKNYIFYSTIIPGNEI
jgi:peptidoglycan hydrolase-like protein with peptidoglycan-binding domain